MYDYQFKERRVFKRLMDLEIPEIYQVFPKDFHVDVNGWSFVDYEDTKYINVQLTDSEVAELKECGLLDKVCHIFGNVYKVKRLRTLDIELASDMGQGFPEKLDRQISGCRGGLCYYR